MKATEAAATLSLESLRRAKKLLGQQLRDDDLYFWCPYCNQTTEVRRLPCCDQMRKAAE